MMSDEHVQNLNFQCSVKVDMMDLLNATEDPSLCTSALIAFAPVLFGADAPETICLLHTQ